MQSRACKMRKSSRDFGITVNTRTSISAGVARAPSIKAFYIYYLYIILIFIFY